MVDGFKILDFRARSQFYEFIIGIDVGPRFDLYMLCQRNNEVQCLAMTPLKLPVGPVGSVEH